MDNLKLKDIYEAMNQTKKLTRQDLKRLSSAESFEKQPEQEEKVEEQLKIRSEGAKKEERLQENLARFPSLEAVLPFIPCNLSVKTGKKKECIFDKQAYYCNQPLETLLGRIFLIKTVSSPVMKLRKIVSIEGGKAFTSNQFSSSTLSLTEMQLFLVECLVKYREKPHLLVIPWKDSVQVDKTYIQFPLVRGVKKVKLVEFAAKETVIEVPLSEVSDWEGDELFFVNATYEHWMRRFEFRKVSSLSKFKGYECVFISSEGVEKGIFLEECGLKAKVLSYRNVKLEIPKEGVHINVPKGCFSPESFKEFKHSGDKNTLFFHSFKNLLTPFRSFVETSVGVFNQECFKCTYEIGSLPYKECLSCDKVIHLKCLEERMNLDCYKCEECMPCKVCGIEDYSASSLKCTECCQISHEECVFKEYFNLIGKLAFN